jgi:hypothetical protein
LRNFVCGNAIGSFDRVAQLVEQRTFNPQALGSNPSPVISQTQATSAHWLSISFPCTACMSCGDGGGDRYCHQRWHRD